jgi:alkane 1-monooxygenase
MLAVAALPLLVLASTAVDAPAYAKVAAWLTWLVLVLVIDRVGPRVASRACEGARASSALPLGALLLQTLVLAYGLWHVSRTAAGPLAIAALALALGISGGTVGISAAHELVHRRGALARGAAQVFMLLVSYPHFALVHLRVHHPYVGTPLDPGTSRLGEPLPRFVGRAYLLGWRSGWRVEKARLARGGCPACHPRNALLRAAAAQALVYALVAWSAGGKGLALFVAQGAVAVVLALAVDYTQHYGVVRREDADGHLEKFRAHHAWTTDHASNRATFNLGLHADHHLAPARTYLRLGNAGRSLQAPLGYPGLVLLAAVPPLWYRVMNPRLGGDGEGRLDARGKAALAARDPSSGADDGAA